jgi:Zn finger protein HypA/HybF involved in hydrogenase expression
MSPAIGEFAALEAERLRQVNARLLFALQVARAALDAAVTQTEVRPGWAWCPLCEQVQPTIDDGETCAQCKLVL